MKKNMHNNVINAALSHRNNYVLVVIAIENDGVDGVLMYNVPLMNKCRQLSL